MKTFNYFISESAVPESFKVNFNLVVKNVEELNVLTGADKTVIAHTKGGATLKVLFLILKPSINSVTFLSITISLHRLLRQYL